MNQKAITPLISTVFLILFAVALGVLVMSWGQASYSDAPKSCEKASINLISVENKPQACYKDSRLQMTLENNGETELSGVMVSVIGKEGIYQGELQSTIGVAEIEKLETGYEIGIGQIMQLRIVPQISSGKLCANKVFKVEGVSSCS